jgi:hypothetical protein
MDVLSRRVEMRIYTWAARDCKFGSKLEDNVLSSTKVRDACEVPKLVMSDLQHD